MESRYLESVLTNEMNVVSRCACILLTAISLLLAGCDEQKKAEAAPADVEVVQVVQKDVPITREWVATLSGFVNAQIRAQVSGYLLKQDYTNVTAPM